MRYVEKDGVTFAVNDIQYDAFIQSGWSDAKKRPEKQTSNVSDKPGPRKSGKSKKE